MSAPFDIDLDAIAPPPVRVHFRGEVYELPGDLALVDVAEATRLYAQLTNSKSTPDQMQQSLERLYDLLMELFRHRNPDVPDLRLTPTDVGYLTAMVISGGFEKTVDDAVATALTGKTSQERKAEQQAGNGGGRPPTKTKSRRTRTAKP